MRRYSAIPAARHGTAEVRGAEKFLTGSFTGSTMTVEELKKLTRKNARTIQRWVREFRDTDTPRRNSRGRPKPSRFGYDLKTVIAWLRKKPPESVNIAAMKNMVEIELRPRGEQAFKQLVRRDDYLYHLTLPVLWEGRAFVRSREPLVYIEVEPIRVQPTMR